MVKAKQIKMEDVSFTLLHFDEDVPIEGNACAYETDAENEECYKHIRDQLDAGNTWAWCWIKLIGCVNGLEAFETLGGCSYQSEKDFIETSGYYDDMKDNVLKQLQDQANRLVEQFAEVTS